MELLGDKGGFYEKLGVIQAHFDWLIDFAASGDRPDWIYPDENPGADQGQLYLSAGKSGDVQCQ